jgi:hypothetical protein
MNVAPRFECELPPPVRQELFKPKKPKIVNWTAVVQLAVILGVLTIWSLFLKYPPAPDPKDQAIMQRIIAATSVQLSQSTPVATHPVFTPPDARKARREQGFLSFEDYSNPPAPKAELIKLPAWQIGETRPMQMRYGEVVNATLRGQVDSYNQLPRRGQLGDMWIVDGTPWIWTHPSGSAFTTWIDP